MKIIKELKNVYFKLLKLKNKIIFGGPTLVLMYHRVSNIHTKSLEYLTVSVDVFDAQLKYLKNNYKTFNLSDSWNLPFYKKGVVITFDDGYADNLLNALPILEKYNIPATIFVCTKNLDTNENFWWDELAMVYDCLPNRFLVPKTKEKIVKNNKTYKYLNSIITDFNNSYKNNWIDDLKKMNNIFLKNTEPYRSLTKNELIKLSSHPLITIGGHTHNHYSLAKLSKDEQKKEIEKNHLKLKEILRKEIEYFAFPHGSYNEETKEILKKDNVQISCLANDYYSNEHKKKTGIVSRILITNISGAIFRKRLNKFV